MTEAKTYLGQVKLHFCDLPQRCPISAHFVVNKKINPLNANPPARSPVNHPTTPFYTRHGPRVGCQKSDPLKKGSVERKPTSALTSYPPKHSHHSRFFYRWSWMELVHTPQSVDTWVQQSPTEHKPKTAQHGRVTGTVCACS